MSLGRRKRRLRIFDADLFKSLFERHIVYGCYFHTVVVLTLKPLTVRVLAEVEKEIRGIITEEGLDKEAFFVGVS